MLFRAKTGQPEAHASVIVLISLARVMLFRENVAENESSIKRVLISLARVMLFRVKAIDGNWRAIRDGLNLSCESNAFQGEMTQ